MIESAGFYPGVGHSSSSTGSTMRGPDLDRSQPTLGERLLARSLHEIDREGRALTGGGGGGGECARAMPRTREAEGLEYQRNYTYLVLAFEFKTVQRILRKPAPCQKPSPETVSAASGRTELRGRAEDERASERAEGGRRRKLYVSTLDPRRGRPGGSRVNISKRLCISGN